MKQMLAALFTVFLSLIHVAQAGPGEQTRVYRGSPGGSPDYGYIEYLPPGYDGIQRYPLVIFNHGYGERGLTPAVCGTDPELNKVENAAGTVPCNIRYNINNGIPNIEAVVISPQITADPWAQISRSFVEFLIGKYCVDTNRIYMTGLSMGGGTTWHFARANPDLLAAIVPVCGQPFDTPWGVASLANMPIWAFHNEDDGVVVAQDTTIPWVAAITSAGGSPLMTIYPYAETNLDGTVTINAGHNAWTRTYARQDMWNWLLAQHKAGSAAEPPLTLTAGGVTGYVIVQPDVPSPADGYAVQILASYLQQKTGTAFPVVSSQAVNGHPKICVGLSAATTADLGSQPTAALPDHTFVTRTVGDSVYLYGKGTHGNLYAVVDFLDSTLERRWLVDGDTPAPTANGNLSVAAFSRTTTPSFGYGMLGFPTVLNYQHGCNVGFNEQVKADWGLPAGMVPALDNRAWAHTTFLYMPPTLGKGFPWLQNKAYFASHPDWYTLNPAGQRVAEQLCFSSPGLRAELTANILDHIQRIKQENLGLPVLISLEQEDASTGTFCHCAACAALDASYVSNAGAFFDYLIGLAATVQAQHSDVRIKILAYRSSQTQAPPTLPAGTPFPSNVVVEFCSVEDVLNKTWEDPRNSGTYADLCGWAALTPHVWAWRYHLYSAGLLMPFSNISRMKREMEMAAALGVEGSMFELYPEGGFTDVLQYLYLQLGRHVQADVDDLLTTFCQNQFGPAAAMARTYIDEVEAASQTGAKDMDIIHSNIDFGGAFSYLTDERIRNWQGDFDTMVALAGSNSRYQTNIKSLRRSLDFATIGKWTALAATDPSYFSDYTVVTGRIGSVNATRKPVLDDWVLKIQAGGIHNPLPAFFNSFPSGSISERVPLNNSNDPVKNVLDATAAFGYAATVNGPDLPFSVAFYRGDTGQMGPTLSISQSSITPEVWTFYHLGEITLSSNCGIYLGGSWMTSMDLGPSFEPTGENRYQVYVSLKFEGAGYGGTGENTVLCDRVVLIQYSEAPPATEAIRLTTGTASIAGWEYDQPYVSDQTSGWGNNTAYDIQGYWPTISGTTEQALYSVERWGNFSHAVPVDNGTYTVTLHFAELFCMSAGSRVFDVTMEGMTSLDNFEIVAEAGARFTAIQRTIEVTVTDGVLNIDFQGVVNSASVCAIEITPTVDTTLRLTTGTDSIAGWENDQPYVSQQTSGWGDNTAYDIQGYWPTIIGTSNQALYSVERWGNFSYAVPVNDGTYDVTLHFAELFCMSAGARVFDVAIEGVTALDDFDIVAEAGARFTAIQRTIEVTVTDGVLNIDFQGVVNSASVCAIEVAPTVATTLRLTTGTNSIAGWEYDQPYVSQQTSGWGNNTAYDIQGYWPTINGTSNQALYSVERWGNFSYAIPVSDGTFTVTLHFAELFCMWAGSRVFDVTMEGATALDNFDIVAEAGGRFTAIERTLEVTVTDGVLNIDFQGVVNSASVCAVEVSPNAGP